MASPWPREHKNIKLILLVGLPGAGKSTFSKLFETCEKTVAVINQDELGRKECENRFLSDIKSHDITILDRCNVSKSQRKEWIESSLLRKDQILCVYLTTEKSLCQQRVVTRKNHKTIPFGTGHKIVERASKMLEIPDQTEGFMIVRLNDEYETANFLKRYGCKTVELEENNHDRIHKFPRTQHLVNLGSATRDDLVVDQKVDDLMSLAHYGDSIDICEKVDGAQIGISMNADFSFKVQNRSHYVNSKSHFQFKELDKWLSKFSQDLYSVIDEDLILFGEWMYCTHSIEYDQLPSYFLAFDLYDKIEKKFYSRQRLLAKLQNTQLSPVPSILSSDFKQLGTTSIQKTLVEEKMSQSSSFGSHQMEGLYIKVNKNGWVTHRSKIVRENFIAGNQHWTKGIYKKNRLIEF